MISLPPPAPAAASTASRGSPERKPEVTMLYAREDLRHGLADARALGSESVMVNDLAVTAAGEVYAAASDPGQVLQLIPRTEGDFLSPVIPAPAVAKLGSCGSACRRACLRPGADRDAQRQPGHPRRAVEPVDLSALRQLHRQPGGQLCPGASAPRRAKMPRWNMCARNICLPTSPPRSKSLPPPTAPFGAGRRS